MLCPQIASKSLNRKYFMWGVPRLLVWITIAIKIYKPLLKCGLKERIKNGIRYSFKVSFTIYIYHLLLAEVVYKNY